MNWSSVNVLSIGDLSLNSSDRVLLKKAGFQWNEPPSSQPLSCWAGNLPHLVLVRCPAPSAWKHVGEATSRGIPTLVVCDEGTPSLRAEAFAAGADDVILAPLSVAEFLHRAERLIRAKTEREDVQLLNDQLTKDKSLLARYFSDDMIHRILSQGSTSLESTHLTVSVLFFDIRDSTRIAERLPPAAFSTFLSELFTDIMDLVYGNHGSVNKLLGDGMLATFGCPAGTPEDALNSVRTALQIQEYLQTFNDVLPDYLDVPIQAGIGIATGQVFAGNIGSVRRIEYTVLGDAVNTASRLEALTKETGTDILIDGTTLAAAGPGLIVEPIAQKNIRGKVNEIQIYHLKGIPHAD